MRCDAGRKSRQVVNLGRTQISAPLGSDHDGTSTSEFNTFLTHLNMNLKI